MARTYNERSGPATPPGAGPIARFCYPSRPQRLVPMPADTSLKLRTGLGTTRHVVTLGGEVEREEPPRGVHLQR